MKVIKEEQEPQFVPVHIVLESKREVELMKEILYCAGDNAQKWTPHRDALAEVWTDVDVRDMRDLQANIWLEL